MQNKALLLSLIVLFFVSACDDSEDDPLANLDIPTNYEFSRDGSSTVAFSGQTTRIQMGEELLDTMLDFDNATETLLLRQYRNADQNGNDVDPFSSAELNNATKNIKGKVAASTDYFGQDATTSSVIKSLFEVWLRAQVNDINPNRNQAAQEGQAGQLDDNGSARYVNANGLEYNQAVNKGLIGALMMDQMLNNYLSPAVLDAGQNRENNDNAELDGSNNYTTMEHKWDEAYGYLFGNAANPATPLTDLGSADSFLNKYLGRVEGKPEFEGTAQAIYDAFKTGRAAIVAGEYDLRDEQAAIIRAEVSEIIGVMAVFYLQAAKDALENPGNPLYGTAFHDLSECYGFLFSLQFTRVPGTENPYFTRTQVESFMSQIYPTDNNQNGFWDVETTTLDQLSQTIADEFGFSVEGASASS